MNISLALIDAIRRFAARRGLLRVVEKRTYVFILVPFNFRGNSHATSAELEQRLIDISGSADESRTNALFSTLGPFNPAGSSTTAERDVDLVSAESMAAEQEQMEPLLRSASRVTFNLVAPFFLNFFRLGPNGFNTKTRREN
jgi:hypothetical protein